MPMKPGKGESQSEFTSRCVPDMMGPNKDKRPQEQAVAICLHIWREHKGGKKPEKATSAEQVKAIIERAKRILKKDPTLALIVRFTEDDVPDPDDDESHEEFMDRCRDELEDGGDEGNGAMQASEIEDACE